MDVLHGVKMDLSKSARPVDQATTTNIQQALRRLKYLHTSRASRKGASLKPIKTTSSPPIEDFKSEEERCDLSRSRTDKRCVLALSPDNVLQPYVEDRKRKQIPKQRVGFRSVCKGRAPLRGTTRYQLNPTFRQLSAKRKTPWDNQQRDAAPSQRDVEVSSSSHGKERTAKSAPASGGISSLNPEEFDCIQCFANEVERIQRTEDSPKYTNNIKINRVTFSARPQPKETNTSGKSSRVTKITTEKTFNIPQTLYGGWGVRSRRRSTNADTTRKNPRDTRKDFDAMELQNNAVWGRRWSKK